MRLSFLSVKRFRNIGQIQFNPDPLINLLIGPNAQGKTSILEAIGFLSQLRSFRRAKPQELLQQGESFSEIEGQVISHEATEADWRSDLKVVLAQDGPTVSKAAFVNGKNCASVTQYLSHRAKALGGSFGAGFHAVSFNPSDHEFIRGEPRLRREALNQILSAEDVTYLSMLKRYQKVLDQRNAVLKSGSTALARALEPFDEQYEALALAITLRRLEWLSRLEQRLNTVLHRIAPEQAEIQLFYGSDWIPKNKAFSFNNKILDAFHFTGQGPLPSLEELKQAFRRERALVEKTEWFAQSTLLGPHREDWLIFLGDQPLKAKGSQGEVRSTLLALKLCEIELFHERTGLKPIFLLDDFSSELDRVRRKFLLNFIVETDLQVFVTATERIDSMGRFYQVLGGQLSPGVVVPETKQSSSHQPQTALF